MNVVLPTAIYHTSLPPASSFTLAAPRPPNHVFEWADFNRLALKWVVENFEENEIRRIKRPVFTDIRIAEEDPQLQPFVFLNLLKIAQPLCSSCEFNAWSFIDRSDPEIRGKPDFAMINDNSLAAIGEIKGKWTLPDADIVNVSFFSNF